MSYQLYIFDLDGTLIDSSPSIKASLSLMQQRCHLPLLNQETLTKFIGPPLNESMMKYYGVSEEETGHLLAVYRQCYLEQGINATKVFPGVLELLDTLKKEQKLIAVATIKQYVLAREVLKLTGIQERIDYAALDPTNRIKDKTPLFQECLDYFHIDPVKALVIGDSPTDGIAAKQAGIDFLAFISGAGFPDPESLRDIDYVQTVNTVDQMKEYILER